MSNKINSTILVGPSGDYVALLEDGRMFYGRADAQSLLEVLKLCICLVNIPFLMLFLSICVPLKSSLASRLQVLIS